MRWFLAAIILIAALMLVAPESFRIFEGMSSLEAAITFVSMFGAVAVCKAMLGSRSGH